MIEKLKDKLEEIKLNNCSKKLINNLIILIFIGIVLILASNNFTPSKDVISKDIESIEDKDIDKYKNIESDLIGDYEKKIEMNLKEILSEIRGVGNIRIMVNLEDTAERIPAFNTVTVNENTDENDAGGGARKVVREDLKQEVVTANGDSLMIIKEVKPNVKGVIVVAEGAEDIKVKENLYSAVKTVLGISGNKVEVYPSK